MRRLAEEKDLKQVFDIYMDESVVHYLGYDSMSLESFRPVYQRLLHDKNFFVYEVSGDIAGFYVLGGSLMSAGAGGSVAIEGRFVDAR